VVGRATEKVSRRGARIAVLFAACALSAAVSAAIGQPEAVQRTDLET